MKKYEQEVYERAFDLAMKLTYIVREGITYVPYNKIDKVFKKSIDDDTINIQKEVLLEFANRQKGKIKDPFIDKPTEPLTRYDIEKEYGYFDEQDWIDITVGGDLWHKYILNDLGDDYGTSK